MIPTANWYCVKCSRFVDNRSAICDVCGRTRGSARSRSAQEEPSLYWIRVTPGSKSERAKAPDRRSMPPR